MIFLKLFFLIINVSAFSMRQNWHETRSAALDAQNLQTLREKLIAPPTRRILMDEIHQQKLAEIRSFERRISLMKRRN